MDLIIVLLDSVPTQALGYIAGRTGLCQGLRGSGSGEAKGIASIKGQRWFKLRHLEPPPWGIARGIPVWLITCEDWENFQSTILGVLLPQRRPRSMLGAPLLRMHALNPGIRALMPLSFANVPGYCYGQTYEDTHWRMSI